MASKIYVAPETTIIWTDTGGNKLLDLGALAADAVAMGAWLDLGSGSRAIDYEIELFINGFATAPIIGDSIDLYLSQSNAETGFDGVPSTDPTATVEGTMTVAQLVNTKVAGSVTVVSTTAGDNLKNRFIVRLPARYVSPVVHNNTADALLGTADVHTVKLTPIPLEGQ